MIHKLLRTSFVAALSIVLLAACAPNQNNRSDLTWDTLQDSTDIVQQISNGLQGPEGVRYDPQQDVYFISNFNGDGNARDANGFITKASAANGEIQELKYMTGTDEFPLHAPRGMYISSNTLWVTDVDGVHGFNTQTGEHEDFVDFSSLEPGFLNDIVEGPDGHLYVTDTGESALYKIRGMEAEVVLSSLPSPPNGITLDPKSNELLLAPWDGYITFLKWKPGLKSANYAFTVGGGNFDGIEYLDNRLIVASQTDKSIHMQHAGKDQMVIETPGLPADIGLDTKRKHIAVPYIAKNRVDIWKLPRIN